MARPTRFFRKVCPALLAIGWLCLPAITPTPCRAGDEQAVIESTRQLAEQFADLVIRRDTAARNIDPVQLYDRQTAEQIDDVSRRLAELRDGKLGNRIDDLYRERGTREAVQAKAESLRTAYYASMALVLPIPALMTAAGMSSQSTNLAWFGAAVVICLRQMMPNAHGRVDEYRFRLEGEAMTRIRAEIYDVFFGRLDELGIRYDRRDRLNWLFTQLDGGPATSWSTLSAAEKDRWSRDYRTYLEGLSTQLSESKPEASREIAALAARVSTATPDRWYSFWKFKSYRRLAAEIPATFGRLAELDREHHFTGDARILSYLANDLRTVIDHADLFTAGARDFFRGTRLSVPDELAVLLPRVRELGGTLDITPAAVIESPGQARIDFRFAIRWSDPARAPLTHEFSVRLPTTATDPRLLIQAEAPRYALEFGNAFASAVASADLGERVRTLHELAFPAAHCATALSEPGALASVGAVAAAAR